MKLSFLFQVGEGWINLGQVTPPTDGQEQFAVYMLNSTLPAYTSLNRCASNCKIAKYLLDKIISF